MHNYGYVATADNCTFRYKTSQKFHKSKITLARQNCQHPVVDTSDSDETISTFYCATQVVQIAAAKNT